MKTHQFLLLGVLSIVMLAICLSIGCQGGDDDDSGDDDDDTEEECPSDEIWSPEFMECIPEECGLNRYPDAPFDDMDLIYVDASFAGESDGGEEKPYASLEVALNDAGPNTSILIAAGEYKPSDTLEISQDGLDLVGRCPYLTRLSFADSDSYLLWVYGSESNLIKGITFGPEESGEKDDESYLGIKFLTTESTTFTENVVQNASGDGLFVQNSTDLAISNNEFDGNTETGICLSTSSGTISENEIRNTRPDEQGHFGRGIIIENCGQMAVTDNLLEENTETGIFYYQSTGPGTISGNEVRGTLPNGQADFGYGIEVISSSSATVSNNIVEHNTEVGILFSGSTGTVSGNEVRYTQMDSGGKGGRGITVQDSDQVTVSNNIVENNSDMGITVIASNGTISGNEVRDIQSNGQGEFGRGINIEEDSDVTLENNIVERSSEIGIAFLASTGTISGNEVRDTRPSAPNQWGYTGGHGIHVQWGADVECSENIVEDNVHMGICYLDSQGGLISSNEVRGTVSEKDGEWDFGDGIAVILGEGFTTVQGNTVEDNLRAGVLFDFSTGMIEMNGITGNYYSIVGQNHSMIEINGNTISDNTVNEVQEYEERVLPVYDQPL